MSNPNITKASDILLLATVFLLAAMIAGQLISHAALATDSSAPAKKDTTPVGTVVSWAGEAKSIPKAWMLCDGKLLDRGKYQELFNAIGTSWGGQGDKFNLPDLRGRFLRGEDAGSNRDPDRNNRSAARQGGNKVGVGSVQESTIQNHSHIVTTHKHAQYAPPLSKAFWYATGPNYQTIPTKHDYSRLTEASKSKIEDAVRYGTKSSLEVGEENRPVNAAVHWIIKVK